MRGVCVHNATIKWVFTINIEEGKTERENKMERERERNKRIEWIYFTLKGTLKSVKRNLLLVIWWSECLRILERKEKNHKTNPVWYVNYREEKHKIGKAFFSSLSLLLREWYELQPIYWLFNVFSRFNACNVLIE